MKPGQDLTPYYTSEDKVPYAMSFLQTKIGAGRLMGPKGVAVDRNGHIIVVDNKSCCVFTFQPNGKLVGRFGGRGATDRHFAGMREPT